MKHILVRVSANAKSTEIIGKTIDGIWRIRVGATPVNGRANKELIRYLAEILEVAPSEISLLKGHVSKIKKLAIPDHVSLDDVF